MSTILVTGCNRGIGLELCRQLHERGDDVMFYTYSAHPASCAAASAVLDILEREDLVARAAEQGTRLRIQVAGERISIPPDALISIEHERGDGGEEVELQLKW